MSVLRAHRHERDFTILGNPTLRDRSLSFRARGLLVFLLSQTDGFTVNAADLAAEATEGRDAIITALKELEAGGYLTRRKEQDERGRWRTFTDVYEAPELAATDNGFSGVGESRRSEAITAGRTGYGLSEAGQAVAIEKGLSRKDKEEVPVEPTARPDVDALCQKLADRIVANGGSQSKYSDKAASKAWRESMRLLLERDLAEHNGTAADRVAKAIDWCQDDDFWRGVVLSPAKLREQFDQLRLAAQRQRNGNGRPKETSADHDERVAQTLRDLDSAPPLAGASPEEWAAYYARFETGQVPA